MASRSKKSQRDIFGRQLLPIDVGNDWEPSGIPTSPTRTRRSGKTKTFKPPSPTEPYYKPSAPAPTRKQPARAKRRLGMTCASPTAVAWSAQYADLAALLDAAAQMHASALDDAMACARQKAHTENENAADALAAAAQAHTHALADAWGALQRRACV